MNETEFQAIFEGYENAVRSRKPDPVPQKLHLLVYNYAQLRHQQTTDVAADFYLFVMGKMPGILARYDARKIPFYQYLATQLKFEFQHFLRRRKAFRSSQISTEELAARRVELQYNPNEDLNLLDEILAQLEFRPRVYAKLALTHPLTYAEIRQMIRIRKITKDGDAWQMLRSYRAFLRHAEEKRLAFGVERERLLKILLRLEGSLRDKPNALRAKIMSRREKTAKKFFSIDARIPLRMLAAVTGDPIATVQRQLKGAISALKKVYQQWEKQNLFENNETLKGAR